VAVTAASTIAIKTGSASVLIGATHVKRYAEVDVTAKLMLYYDI